MVSVHVSGSSVPGSSPGQGELIVFLGKTLPTVLLSSQVYKRALVILMLGVTLQWTSITSKGSRNSLTLLMLQKQGYVLA